MPLSNDAWYAPVRKYDGVEYLSVSDIHNSPQNVHKNNERIKDLMPRWHEANPIVRVVRVKIEEIEE